MPWRIAFTNASTIPKISAHQKPSITNPGTISRSEHDEERIQNEKKKSERQNGERKRKRQQHQNRPKKSVNRSENNRKNQCRPETGNMHSG
jgi:hypothetical protein